MTNEIQYVITFMIFMLLLILFSCIFFIHPIPLICLLILYSILMCMNLSTWKSNYIYSIMLFLIMISGLLIIFLYFSSLISNEQMIVTPNIYFFLIFTPNLILFLYFYKKKNFFNFSFSQFKDTSTFNKINEKMFSNITSIYEYPFNNMTILCMFYLILTLITIIKLCSISFMPMRKIS